MSTIDLVKAASERSYMKFEDLALNALKEKVQENPRMQSFLEKLNIAQNLDEGKSKGPDDLSSFVKQGQLTQKKLDELIKDATVSKDFKDFKYRAGLSVSDQILARFKPMFESGPTKEDIAKEYGVSVKEVSDAWSKAAGMAKADGKDSNFAYIVDIVRGMLK